MKGIPSASEIQRQIEQAARRSQRRIEQRLKCSIPSGRVPTKGEIERIVRDEQRRIQADIDRLC